MPCSPRKPAPTEQLQLSRELDAKCDADRIPIDIGDDLAEEIAICARGISEIVLPSGPPHGCVESADHARNAGSFNRCREPGRERGLAIFVRGGGLAASCGVVIVP